jgi:hypothetical protein
MPPEKLAEVREEIGDVMIYLTELAEKLGIDPVEAAKAKATIKAARAAPPFSILLINSSRSLEPSGDAERFVESSSPLL